MAYTYSNAPDVGGTAAQKRDAVRLLTQDNQLSAASTYKLTDEEIAFFLANEANAYMAAAAAAETIAARYGGVTSRTVGDLKLEMSADDYRTLAQQLRARGRAHQIPFVGGISIDDKEDLRADTDWVPPIFASRMQENPEAGSRSENPALRLSDE